MPVAVPASWKLSEIRVAGAGGRKGSFTLRERKKLVVSLVSRVARTTSAREPLCCAAGSKYYSPVGASRCTPRHGQCRDCAAWRPFIRLDAQASPRRTKIFARRSLEPWSLETRGGMCSGIIFQIFRRSPPTHISPLSGASARIHVWGAPLKNQSPSPSRYLAHLLGHIGAPRRIVQKVLTLHRALYKFLHF